MDDVAKLSDRPDPNRDAGGAVLAFRQPDPDPGDQTGTAGPHGQTSLFDRIGRLLGLDAPLRRWMLADRLAALLELGIAPGEALRRLRATSSDDNERDAIDRAIERLDAGDGLADALAAADLYAPRHLDALRAATDAPAEATALTGLAATLRRHLTWRYTAALAGAALALVLAGLLLRHGPEPRETSPVAIAPPAIVAKPAPSTATPAADLAPALGPGLSGAPPALVGIVGRLPDDAVAMVRMPSGRTRIVAVGEVFDGWTLASLDAEEAVFTRAGQRVTVALPPAEDQ